MWELVKAGGWLMLPLILSSIFTVAITLERYLRLKRSQVLPQDLLVNGADLETLVAKLEQEQAMRSPLGRILKAGYDHKDQGEQFARAQMEAAVLGIIESFLVIDVGSAGNASTMMPGISKALITTAVGMLIAIPAMIAYRYFQRVVHEYVAELEQQSILFHAALFYKKVPHVQEHRRAS